MSTIFEKCQTNRRKSTLKRQKLIRIDAFRPWGCWKTFLHSREILISWLKSYFDTFWGRDQLFHSRPESSFETRFFILDQIPVIDLEEFLITSSWDHSHVTLLEKLVCPVSWVWILKLSMQQTDQNTAQGMDFLQKLTFDFSWFATKFFIRDRILHSRPDSSFKTRFCCCHCSDPSKRPHRAGPET